MSDMEFRDCQDDRENVKHLFVFSVGEFLRRQLTAALYETGSRAAPCGVGSTHLPCSRIRSCNRSTASAPRMLNLTAVLPTQTFTLPGAPPTYPKSASAISP